MKEGAVRWKRMVALGKRLEREGIEEEGNLWYRKKKIEK